MLAGQAMSTVQSAAKDKGFVGSCQGLACTKAARKAGFGASPSQPAEGGRRALRRGE